MHAILQSYVECYFKGFLWSINGCRSTHVILFVSHRILPCVGSLLASCSNTQNAQLALINYFLVFIVYTSLDVIPTILNSWTTFWILWVTGRISIWLFSDNELYTDLTVNAIKRLIVTLFWLWTKKKRKLQINLLIRVAKRYFRSHPL